MPNNAESIRRRIKAERLTDQLQEFIDGDRNMNGAQVTAALGLLKKVAPDLKSVDITAETDSGLTLNIINYAEITDQAAAMVETTPRGAMVEQQDTAAKFLPGPDAVAVEEDESVFD